MPPWCERKQSKRGPSARLCQQHVQGGVRLAQEQRDNRALLHEQERAVGGRVRRCRAHGELKHLAGGLQLRDVAVDEAWGALRGQKRRDVNTRVSRVLQNCCASLMKLT